MAKLAQKHSGVLGFFTVLALSSATMLWLLWHFPIGTGIATVIVLSAFGVSARLARSTESDGLAELDRGNQSA